MSNTDDRPDGNPQTYPGIAGLSLMRRDELDFLESCLVPGGVFLEIGTSDGATAGELSRRRPDLTVWCVDLYAYEPERVLSWLANRTPKMTLLVGRLLDLEGLFPRQRFDAVLVDGGHEEHECRSDLMGASRLVTPGGPIMVHDYRDPNWPGVTAAVDWFAANSPWRVRRNVAFMWELTT